MKRLLRVVKWLFLTLGFLLILSAVGISLYTRTENFTRWAREEAVGVVNDLIRGSISVQRLQGSIWSHLTLYEVALRYENQEILQVPRLDVSFSLLPLLWGQVKIAAITAAQPRATLAQDRDGKWNVMEALSPRQPQPENPSTLALSIGSMLLDDGDVNIRWGGNGTSYHLQHLRLDSVVGIRPESISFEARELSTGFLSKEYPELSLKGGLEYQQRPKEPASVKIKNLWAVSKNSRLKLNGEIIPGEPLKIKAEGTVDKLAPADIQYFVSQWPLKPDLTGRIAVDGALDALHGTVQLAGAGAKVDGKFTADLAQDSPTYSATMTASAFDLRRWLGDKRIAGVMNGTVVASGTGFALKDTAAQVRLEVRSAEAQGWALGALALEGRLQKSVASIDGQLKSKLGGANWSGKIALIDKRPSYELTLAIKDFDMKQTASNGTAFSSKLNLQGAVKGSGFTPAEMNARVDVQISPSSVGPVNVKQGAVSAILQNNRIRIARVSLNTAESLLSASGEIGLDAKMSGKLDYRFRSTDVGPWLSLVSLKGAGALDLTGQAQGNLADLETHGSAQLSRLKVGGSGLKEGNVSYNLRASTNQIFPQGVVTAHLSDVDAGLALRRFDATAKLSQQPSRSIQINLSAQDSHERKHALSGTVDLLPDALNVRLSQASLSAPDGVWKLMSPATVSKGEDGISIAQLALKNGERELSLNGHFAFSGKQDLSLNVDRLPIETLTGFMSEPPKVSGLLAAQARVAGTAAAPEVSASARLTNAAIAGQAYAGANAEANYRNKRASLRLIVQQDSSHVLNGSGVVPLDLSWSSGWRAEFANGMELRAQSAGLSLAFANAFSGKSVQDIGGEASLDILARGSLKQPDLRGTFGLRDGKLKVVPLGVDVNDVTLAGNLDSRAVTVRELVAKAKDGEIRGSGSLALKDYDINAVKLALTAERWPAIQTQRYQVRIGGNVDVQGSLTAPRMSGQLNIIDGSLRPDLAFLEQSKVPLKRDETIAIVNHRGVADFQTQAQPRGGANENDLFKKLTLDLTLRAPGNLWIRHPELVAELSGNIHATKKPERNIDLTGRVDIVRGSLAFQGRRFQLTRGGIEFTGGDKINPALDITAQYKLPEYEVDVAIAGTAEKPSLTLTSQPRLEQADILALLLFGRPVNALSQNERGSVQQSALSITSGFVAGKIANSVSQALGLDTLGIDLREVDFSGGRVGFGHYVGSNTYVSLSQQLSGDHGQEVSMEYQLTPEWKIGTSGGTTGTNNGVDIIWHKRY
jgi:autotransporter translocation and assembly factor TamB